jgi:hypothetical protein
MNGSSLCSAQCDVNHMILWAKSLLCGHAQMPEGGENSLDSGKFRGIPFRVVSGRRSHSVLRAYPDLAPSPIIRTTTRTTTLQTLATLFIAVLTPVQRCRAAYSTLTGTMASIMRPEGAFPCRIGSRLAIETRCACLALAAAAPGHPRTQPSPVLAR